jgi:hypothetical protein
LHATNSMRTIILCFTLVFLGRSIAQEQPAPDTLLLQQKVNEFAILLEAHTARIDRTAEIDSIHMLAAELQERSALLLEEVVRVHPLDSNLLFEVKLNEVPQFNMDPVLSLEYQRRAYLAQEQIDATMPPYYKALRKINEISTRMQSMRRPKKAQRSNQEIKEIDLFAREGQELRSLLEEEE